LDQEYALFVDTDHQIGYMQNIFRIR